MNQYQVMKITKHFAKDLFNMEWTLPIEFNGRLTRALGRMMFRRDWKTGKFSPTKMQLATRLLENYSIETIESVIKHELCHWALCLQGRPFDDHHPVFEAELRRIGAHSTGVIQLAGLLYTAVCKSCNKTILKHNSQGKLWKYVKSNSKYTTKCCTAKMKYGEIECVEDTNSLTISKTQVPAAPVRPSVPYPSAAIKPATTLAIPTSLDEVLEKGPRGVTNKQMIPAIQKCLDLNSKSLLDELEKAYPAVFQATIRYIGRNYQAKLAVMRG